MNLNKNIGVQLPGIWKIIPLSVSLISLGIEYSSMITLDSMAWATCQSKHPPPLTCSLNYEQLGDICIRISTIPLSWYDAEEKCKREGGHLISISSASIQSALMNNIKEKIDKIHELEDEVLELQARHTNVVIDHIPAIN